MSHYKKNIVLFAMLIIASMAFSACTTSGEPTPEMIETATATVEPVVVTQPVAVTVEGEPEGEAATATPKPVPTVPAVERTLVVCQGQEPDTLYPYDRYETGLRASLHIQQAIWDGPIDNRSFAYEPVILQKVPNLADGDAVLQKVDVRPGMLVIDSAQFPTILEPGVIIQPSGCTDADCAIVYDGSSTIQMDQLVVTFRLKPGLVWSDGTPLTARDSLYSYQLQADDTTPASKFIIERTAAYESLDDLTLQWKGIPGFKDSQYQTNFWTPYPQHIWGAYTPEELLDAEISTRKPLGWGPYIIDEWIPGDRIVLHKNPLYFRASEGLPVFDHLIFRFVGTDTNANIAQLLSGECDLIDQTAQLDDQIEMLLALEEEGQADVSFVMSTVFEHVDFGIIPTSYDNGWQTGDRPDFFGDPKVRQAIALCMDRQAVVERVGYGLSTVMDSYLPSTHPLYNSSIQRYTYDIEAGSSMLEEAGWVPGADGVRVYRGNNTQIPIGTRLEFSYWTTKATQRQQTAQILAESMAACGIQANVEAWDVSEFFLPGPDGPVFGRKFDLAQFTWEAGVEPPCDLWTSESIPGEDLNTYPYGWGGWNISGFNNPDYDEACRTALAALPGQAAYEENHQQAQAIFAAELPSIPLYPRLQLAMTRPDFCGFEMDATASSELWNIEAFDYGDCADTQ